MDEKISCPKTGAGYGGGGVPGGVTRGNSLTSISLCLMCLEGNKSFIDSEAIKRLLASAGDIAVVPSCSGLDLVRWCLLRTFEVLKLASWENWNIIYIDCYKCYAKWKSYIFISYAYSHKKIRIIEDDYILNNNVK